MKITPDLIVYWQQGMFKLNATILFTWINILLLVCGSAAVTLRLRSEQRMPRSQNFLEVLVAMIQKQIEDMGLRPAQDFLPFLGALFLFILLPNLLSIIHGYPAPTGSLSTSAALALAVFVAVPIWGIRRNGLANYLRQYIQPTPFMLPFNVMGEFSRTLALAVRLFGNIMSGGMIAGIFLSLAPLFFPLFIQILGLITGVIQAYIFTVLAAVYIASAVQAHDKPQQQGDPPPLPQKGEIAHG